MQDYQIVNCTQPNKDIFPTLNWEPSFSSSIIDMMPKIFKRLCVCYTSSLILYFGSGSNLENVILSRIIRDGI